MSKEREQKLIDILFEVAMTLNSSTFPDMTREELAEWIRRQLKGCGFPTTPIGSSWGILDD